MAAHRGTLFLDEIEEMSPRMQALLLRFAESGEVHRVGSSRVDGIADARVIAASNRDLTEGWPRERSEAILYYRLNVIPLRVPALRERVGRRRPPPAPLSGTGDGVAGPSSARSHACVRVALCAYHWPGNVRELRNLAERIAARSTPEPVTIDDLPVEVVAQGSLRVWRRAAVTPRTPSAASASDVAWDQMMIEGENFWTPYTRRSWTGNSPGLTCAPSSHEGSARRAAATAT